MSAYSTFHTNAAYSENVKFHGDSKLSPQWCR